MKRLQKLLFVFLAIGVFACGKDDDPGGNTNPNSEYEILEGNITQSMTLDASKRYLLKGIVYVNEPAELTIPAGTHVFGDKASKGALVINRGAKIHAQGTASNPVIFTSSADPGFRNAGDWAGIVILGRGVNNQGTDASIEGITVSTGESGKHGGTDNNDSSGDMTYTRIEFAGIALSPGNELNSLTLGSVGAGTDIHHIQVSYAGDDSYEWFGGASNHEYLVAYKGVDDDFDVDQGYSGKVQYGVSIRSHQMADYSGSRGIEASSNSNASASPHTSVAFANMTLIGPKMSNSSISGDFKAGINLDKNAEISVYNSIIAGFPDGIAVNGEGDNGGHFHKVLMTGYNSGRAVVGTPKAATEVDTITASSATEIFATTPDVDNPAPMTVKTAYQTGAAPLPAGFEDNDFFGAFGSTASEWNWNSGWLEFNPINAAY